MKKILWTSIVWVILFLVFVAYMRFFNLDLGIKLCKILHAYNCTCPEIEQVTKEDLANKESNEFEENFITKIIEEDDADREKLFKQLDRIEVLVKNNNVEKTEEELFDEFKTWYNQGKDDKEEK